MLSFVQWEHLKEVWKPTEKEKKYPSPKEKQVWILKVIYYPKFALQTNPTTGNEWGVKVIKVPIKGTFK